MAAVPYDIVIEQGATFNLIFYSLPPATTFVVSPYAELLGQSTVGARPARGNANGDLWYDSTGTFNSRWSRWTGLVWENVTPQDLTNWSARLQFRRTNNDTLPLLALTSPSVSGNGIELGGQHGSILVKMTAAQTTALDPAWAGNLKGVYDLEVFDISSPVTVNRISQGKWSLSIETTR